VLQLETWSLSGGVHHCCKRKCSRKNPKREEIVILFCIPSMLKILQFCWTASSYFYHHIDYILYQGLKILGLKMTVFWDVALCSLMEVYRCFRGSKHLWNVSKLLPDYMAQHPRRQPSSYSPLWETEIPPCWVWFNILRLLSPLLIASMFCIPPLYDPNWNIHLLPGAPLHQWIHANLKENLLPYAIADFLWLCCKNYKGTRVSQMKTVNFF
jgi:hypothetical protein